MNFKELQDELALVLNFTPDTVDQDFNSTQLQSQLNSAYMREVRQAKQNAGYAYFRNYFDFIWPANALTYDLGNQIAWQDFDSFYDITSSEPGYRLIVGDVPGQTDIWWQTPTILQWGTIGPGSERTLRVRYLAKAEKMLNDIDEPQLIPPEYRELLVWSAAVYLRTIADEMAPQAWLGKLEELQHDFWKGLSKGRPHTYVPRVRPSQSDLDELGGAGYYY